MELGELVADVKAGKTGAMLNLWEAVRRFVVQQARRRANLPGCNVPEEDLVQAGFFAMLDAAEAYEPERGAGFLTILAFALRNRFAEEQGIRSTKRDALLYAISADAPAAPDDPDSPTFTEIIEDDTAELPFLAVEYRDFLEYCRGIIESAISTLPPTQALIIRTHFFSGQTLEGIAEQRGSSKQAVFNMEQDGFVKIKWSKYRRLLRECLDSFTEFGSNEEAAFIKRPTEAAAIHDTAA